MRSKAILFFLLLSALMPSAYAADFGEDEAYLGQHVDDYENDDNIAAMIGTVNNETLDCMELNYSSLPGFPGYENFTLYTESDEGGGIVIVNATYLDMTMDRSKTQYIYYDFGVDYFGDWKLYGKLNQDYHNADAWSAFCMFSNYLGGEKNHRDNTEEHIFWVIAGTAGTFRLYEIDDGGNFYATPTKVMIDDTDFWFKMEKTGTLLEIDVYTTRALRDAEGNGDWYDNQLTLTVDYNFRYFYPGNNYDDGLIKLLNMELRNLQFEGTVTGYETEGTYYVDDVLGGDPALAILYNVSIPSGANATMEFSTDNETWVNHNNLAGFDVLVEGYEALDLRDIYNSTLYRRVNFTRGGGETPRMFQARLITVTTITAVGGLFPGLAIGISLLIIGAAYLVDKRR